MSVLERKPVVPFECLNLDPVDQIPDERLRRVMRDRITQCTRCASFREQIAYVGQEIDGMTPPMELLALIFSVNRGTVYNHIQRFRKELEAGVNPRGRSRKLTPEVMRELEKKVAEDYASHNPSTYASLSQWLTHNYGIDITPDVLGAILRREENLKVIKAKPMEDGRVLCDPDAIDDYLDLLKLMVTDRPACMVANLDEMGYLEYQDMPVQTVVVPSFHKGSEMPLMVSRTKRRMSILVCIFADQTTAVPLVVLSRKTVEKELYDFGMTPEKVMFAYQENGFVTTEIFQEWAIRYLLPEFGRRRQTFHDVPIAEEKSRGLIVMDGLKQHFSDYFEDECFTRGIDILQLPAHSSDQTQPSDLCIFASCKKIMPRCSSDGRNSQTCDVDRLLSAMHSACTPHNIRKSFQRAGVSLTWQGNSNVGLLICKVALEHCDRIRHLAVQTPSEESAERTTIPISNRYIPDSEHLPGEIRATMAEELELLQRPDPLPLNWMPDTEFHSQTAELLNEFFPEGTDYLSNQSNM